MTQMLAVVLLLAAGEVAAADPHALARRAYEALAAERREEAVHLLRSALAAETSADRRRQLALDLGHALVALARHHTAAEAFARAVEVRPDRDSLVALGYAHLAAGEATAARIAFQRARTLAPDDALVHRQLGYLYKAAGRSEDAADAFRRALDAGDGADAGQRRRLRREVRELTNDFYGSLTVLWRRDAPDGSPLLLGGRVLSRSQGLAEAAWRLPWQGSGGGRLAVFSRLIWELDGDRPTPADETLQAGIGLRLRPFAGANLVLGAERLVSLGAFARDDWLLRVSWSAGKGFEPPSPVAGRLFWSLYADAALIGIHDRDTQLSGEARLGWGSTVGGLDIVPHLMTNLLVQDDTLGTESLLEAGPALQLRLPLGGTRYRAPDTALLVRLAWRAKLAGSARNADGLTLSVSLSF